jgi:hypothetical protein
VQQKKNSDGGKDFLFQAIVGKEGLIKSGLDETSGEIKVIRMMEEMK